MVLAVLASVVLAHAAATCSDYSTQAAAQRAADTRDADGDGVYCEDLPCPCLKPGGGSAGTPSTPAHRHPRLGRPRALGPWTKRTGCRLDGALPDRACTPGSIYPKAGRRVICVSDYAGSVRDVSESTKTRVYRSYGIRHHAEGEYEIDHLVPLELGGSNSIANLFPQPARPAGGGPGFHRKDRLENVTHDRVCTGAMRLRPTQRRIARNWVRLLHALGL
jgi:hypothetical protein